MKWLKPLRAGAVGIVMACFASLLFIGSVHAQPLYVSASSAQYMTYVDASDWAPPDYSTLVTVACRTNTATYPINDQVEFYTALEGLLNDTTASAGLFQVSDQTGWGFADAGAVSQIWFSPLVDQTHTLSIQIFTRGPNGGQQYTAGQISLLDLTADSQLWNYSWNAGGSPSGPVQVSTGDNIPWGPYQENANLNLSTEFLASHQYELTMIVCSDAGDDTEFVQMQLTGLQMVSEPSAAAFLALCGIALTICSTRLRPRARQRT